MEINGRSTVSYLVCTSRVPSLSYLNRSGSKGAFSFPGATWDRFCCTARPYSVSSLYRPPPLEGYFDLACCVPRIFSTLFLQYFVIFAKVIFGTPIFIGFLGIFGDFGDFW